MNAKVLRGYLEPSWHNKEKKKCEKESYSKQKSLPGAMFVSDNGINHFIWSKIHPINTMEAHLRHSKQVFWYIPNIGKVVFYKTTCGGHFVLLMWPKINRLPLLSDLKDYARFENNHRKQSGLRASAS